MEIFFIVVAVIILLVLLACGFVYNQIVWCKTLPLPKFIEKIIAGNGTPNGYEEASKKQEKIFSSFPIEELTLISPDGATLKGKLLEPKESNGKIIVACHGARSSGIGEFCFMGPYLYENGYTLFMPEHRGCGISDGKFMGYGTHESKDTFLWLDVIKKRFPKSDIYLLGVSMGGATVLMMSDKCDDERIKGIIADCSYTSAWDEFSYQLKTSFHLPNFPLLNVVNLYNKIFAGYSFKDASPISAVKNAKKPILFIHGDKDDYVPFYMRDELYNACKSKKYKLTVEGAVHARSYYQNPEKYQKAIEKFINANN